ncbi:MAG: ATP-binding protein [Chlorobi bacterium]|nr:ATP-binding protein [Chlorobiota bacterium]
MKYITRKIYSRKIEPYLGKNLIKVIIGQRRTGKSYFLFQLMDLVKKKFDKANIIYINKEDLEFDFIKNYSDLLKYVENKNSNSGENFLFIDEIQDIVQFEKALRHFQTKGNFDIYITGSNARLLSGELSTYLSGRYVEIKIYGLSYSEFLNFHNLEDSAQSLEKYIRFGGLPYLRNLQLENRVIYDYLKNVYSAILFKDVVLRHNIRNVAFLERLTFYLADNIGQILSAKKITGFLKSQAINFSNNIVLDYLNYLSDAFFVIKIKRTDIKGKRVLEIGEKYYLEDTGLRHAIIGYKNSDISQALENIVLLHLLINDYEVTIGKLGEKEIDFICDKGDRRTYLQVTLSLADNFVKEREYGNLLSVKDNHRKVVVTADEYTAEMYEGIETWNIRKFLLEFN